MNLSQRMWMPMAMTDSEEVKGAPLDCLIGLLRCLGGAAISAQIKFRPNHFRLEKAC